MNTHKTNPSRNRRGTATMEFVFALPFLLMLMIGMTWLGFSMISQTEVNITARHQAWPKRYDNQDSSPFIFTSHPGYKTKNDFVKGEAKKKIEVSPLFDEAADPSSTQILLAGTWDHRKFQLDKLPNWKKYTQAVVNAKTGDLQNLNGGLNNFRNIVADVGSDFLKNQFRNLLDNDSKSTQATTQTTAAQTQEQLDRAKEKRELLARKSEIQPEFDPLVRRKKRFQKLSSVDERKWYRLNAELQDINQDLAELR